MDKSARCKAAQRHAKECCSRLLGQQQQLGKRQPWIKADLSKRNGNELSKTVTNDGLMITFPHNEEVLGRVMGFRADSAGVDMDRGAYEGVPDGAVLWVPSDKDGAKKVPNGSFLSQLDFVCYKFK
jgi:hypothetical protein